MWLIVVSAVAFGAMAIFARFAYAGGEDGLGTPTGIAPGLAAAAFHSIDIVVGALVLAAAVSLAKKVEMPNPRFREPPARRYVEELPAGQHGARGKDVNMRSP
jgi:hypothetical protein